MSRPDPDKKADKEVRPQDRDFLKPIADNLPNPKETWAHDQLDPAPLEFTPTMEGALADLLARDFDSRRQEALRRIEADLEKETLNSRAAIERAQRVSIDQRDGDKLRLIVSCVLLSIFAAVSILGVVGWLYGRDIPAILPLHTAVSTLTAAVVAYYFAKRP